MNWGCEVGINPVLVYYWNPIIDIKHSALLPGQSWWWYIWQLAEVFEKGDLATRWTWLRKKKQMFGFPKGSRSGRNNSGEIFI